MRASACASRSTSGSAAAENSTPWWISMPQRATRPQPRSCAASTIQATTSTPTMPATRQWQRRSTWDCSVEAAAMKYLVTILTAGFLLGPAAHAAQPAAISAPFRAGASKVDYTPAAAQLPRNFLGVLDPIFVRALVLDNGRTRAALISIDAGAIPTELFNKVSVRAARDLGIPTTQLLLSATHTHSVPFQLGGNVEEKVLQALRESVARLQPARLAWGTGQSFINVNRDRVDPVTNRWWEGPNYEGSSDKTVAVVRVETPAGVPIAVYYNYAVHAVLTGTLDKISGDIPGATSRYVEQTLGSDVVALWSSGAAGDQNPVFFNQTYELREIRIADYAKRGEDILHVMRDSLEKAPADATIAGGESRLNCPARKRTDEGRAGFPGTYVDAGEVSIRLGPLRIGDMYIGTVDGEVYSSIAQRLKRESPFKHTMMSKLTNGSAPTGYIPS